MKKEFEAPQMQTVLLNSQDILTASVGEGKDDDNSDW